MSKSNHQKHEFHVRPKEYRRDKDFIPAKKFLRDEIKHAKWAGKLLSSIFTGEVGRIESIRLVEFTPGD